ncbi:MAG: selenocysteine-specific translation elongation factor [Oscillospiraceae bacterium]|nr:selenocysteine-specific translation elongation factor [Oscillospiraceae bacterium]
MKRAVLGTAGHIDHGKTLLTKALTGVDTDRLAEEKARGITIELGFAPLKLPDGTTVSVVDVPGHERFVRTMMAGASGIDGVLLTVAADDGVMPQTREHLDILRLLRVQTGLTVITKCDLADEARLSAVEEQIRELVRGTFLEGQPVCRVSALTGQGIDALKERICAMVAGIRERSGERPARLEVDRVFPVEGFGNVATGTLTEGTLVPGQEIELFPNGVTGVVRGLQQHNRNVDAALAGTRTAVSFSRLPRGYPQRGQTLAEPGSLAVTDCLTVVLSITEGCPWVIRNSSRLHLFHGTEETVCRLRLLDADSLRAGGSGYAQLQTERPLAVRQGDRFLLRFFSPVLTVGGGSVLAWGDGRLKRNRREVLERLERLASPEPADRLRQLTEDAGLEGMPAERLRLLTGTAPEEFRREKERLTASGQLLELPDGRLVAASAAESALARGLTVLEAWHADYPLMKGMPQAEWRAQAAPAGQTVPEELARLWADGGRLRWEQGLVALPGFEPVFTQEHKIMQRRLMHYYREAWLKAPDRKDVDEKFTPRGPLYPQMMRHLLASGSLIALTPHYAVHFEAYEQALALFRRLCRENGGVTLGQFRTAADISRKYSQLFLEYWDRTGVSRREGDVHVLRGRDTE